MCGVTFLDPGDPARLAERARSDFAERFGRTATVVGRAPGRVNLVGEHTDYNHGLVLPVALPHATYAAMAAREDGRLRFASAQADGVWEGTVADLGPGRIEGWPAYAAGVVWALREDGLDVPGLDVWIDSTVPLGAGLSSSAALECSVGVAVCGLLDLDLTHEGRRLVAAGIRAETEVAGAPTGGMDQTVAVFARAGTALLIDFATGDRRRVPLPLDGTGDTIGGDWGPARILVTDTRVSHALVDGGYAARRADCEKAAEILGMPLNLARREDLERIDDPRVRARARHIVTEIERVEDAPALFAEEIWPELGEMFLESHASMRDDFEISTPELDLAVTTAVEAGAFGARMTGGGFGGSTVALVPRERVDAVARAIDTAFAAHGHRPPAHLLAEPSAGAGLVP